MKHSISPSPELCVMRGDPRACYAQWRKQLQIPEALLLVEFDFACHWLDQPESLPLTAIYCLRGGTLQVAVTDRELETGGLAPFEQYLRWLGQHHLANFDTSRPCQLQPVRIAKPWGCELWYTGVERRGVCSFGSDDARTPIPWLQAALPAGEAGAPGEALVLLKILDPAPVPVQGELYFELHEKKREVYVVTHVDRNAWPDGVGYIRYGFDEARIAEFNGDSQFRGVYLEAVLAYESVRRALDRQAEIGLPPEPAQLARERLLREHMNSFTCSLAVREGDVVLVPPLLPHALQHGIRTIEFQTPSYERKILSFAQKVQTQEHWDTREAVALMRLTPPTGPTLPERPHSSGVKLEQIVDFPDFEVLRATIQPGARWLFDPLASYCLGMVVSGELVMAGSYYRAEQALLFPRSWHGALVAANAAQPLVFLLAIPRG